MGIVVVMDREAQLFEVVFALSPARSFSSLLNCWQQQGDQDGNDGDHDEQFNESEAFWLPV